MRLVSWQVMAAAAVLFLAAAAGTGCSVADKGSCRTSQVTCNGWQCLDLTNGRVHVVVAPELGGRIIQLRLDGFEYLWVNHLLAGQVRTPGGKDAGAKSGDKPAAADLTAWANYGGDKLWPAPQGWSGPEEWPGPPDPFEKGGRTDGGPFEVQEIAAGPDEVALRLTGPRDLYAGIRFIREIRVIAGSTTVALRSTMENISAKPVRWGIWQVTQHAGAPVALPGASGPARSDLMAWAPVNPRSRFPAGYRILFGPEDNSQYALATPAKEGPRLFRIAYNHKVGKAALDCAAGWLAVTHEASGHLFAQTFPAEVGREHPDGASVEFWTSGTGRIQTGATVLDLKETEPWLVESEVLSPFVRLEPGQSTTFVSSIHLAHGSGPVIAVTDSTVVMEPLVLGKEGLVGKVAFFRDGVLRLEGIPGLEGPAAVLGLVEAGGLLDFGKLHWTPPQGAALKTPAINVAAPDGNPLDRLPIRLE